MDLDIYLLTYLHTYLHTYILTYLHTYTLTSIHTCYLLASSLTDTIITLRTPRSLSTPGHREVSAIARAAPEPCRYVRHHRLVNTAPTTTSTTTTITTIAIIITITNITAIATTATHRIHQRQFSSPHYGRQRALLDHCVYRWEQEHHWRRYQHNRYFLSLPEAVPSLSPLPLSIHSKIDDNGWTSAYAIGTNTIQQTFDLTNQPL